MEDAITVGISQESGGANGLITSANCIGNPTIVCLQSNKFSPNCILYQRDSSTNYSTVVWQNTGTAIVPVWTYKNTIQLNAQMATRISAVGFGNSVMQQNCVHVLSAINSTCSQDLPAGSTVMTLVSTTGFVTGNTIQTNLYDGSLFSSVITVNNSTTITLATPLPKLFHGNLSTGGVFVGVKFASSAYALEYGANAWLRVFNAQMQNCFNFVNMYGYGGASSTEMLPDFQSSVVAYNPEVVFLQVLENDILHIQQGILTVAQSIANVQSMITQAQQAGIFVVLGTALPEYAWTDPVSVAAFDKINDYWMSQPTQQPGLLVLPMHEAWLDYSLSNARQPNVTAGTYTDSVVHPTALGAHYLAFTIMYPRLKNVFGQGFSQQWASGLNDAQNFSSAVGMTGNNGTVFTPVTGNCPSNTQAQSSVGSVVTPSIVSSLITDPLSPLQPAWEIVWSHTGGADAPSNINQMRLLPITCPVGTMVVGRAEIEIDNPANLHGYNMIIDFGNNQSSRSIDFATADIDLVNLIYTGRFVLETVPMLVPTGSAGTARLYFTTTPKTAASGAASGATMIWYKASISIIPLTNS